MKKILIIAALLILVSAVADAKQGEPIIPDHFLVPIEWTGHEWLSLRQSDKSLFVTGALIQSNWEPSYDTDEEVRLIADRIDEFYRQNPNITLLLDAMTWVNKQTSKYYKTVTRVENPKGKAPSEWNGHDWFDLSFFDRIDLLNGFLYAQEYNDIFGLTIRTELQSQISLYYRYHSLEEELLSIKMIDWINHRLWK